MIWTLAIIACSDTNKTNTDPSKDKIATQDAGKETTFDPCALQEVRACLMGNPHISCDAHRGVFGVYTDSLVNSPLSKNPEKSCDANTKMKCECKTNRPGVGPIKKKTGARGLRSILENILLKTMYDLPSQDNIDEVMGLAKKIKLESSKSLRRQHLRTEN